MTLQKVIEEVGLLPRAYSGRGMYGKKCLGVSAANDLVVVAVLAQECGRRGLKFPDPKVDQLGKGHILYWPNIEFEKVESARD